MTPDPRFLEIKQKRRAFAEAYVFETLGNGTEAALIVGVTESSAPVRASEWLKEPLVAEYVAYLKLVRAEQAALDGARVIAELEKIAFANIADLLEWHGASETVNPDYMPEEEFNALKEGARLTGNPEPIRDPKTLYPTIKKREGVELKDSAKVSRRTKAAVQAVSIVPTEFGNKVNIQMHGKTGALQALTNILGIQAPKKIEDVTSNLEATRFSIRSRSADTAGETGSVSSPDTRSN